MALHYLLLKLLILTSTVLLADFKELNLSLVKIFSYDKNGNRYRATGFNICKSGLIITNAHVLKHSKKFSIIDYNNNVLPFINIVAVQRRFDLAIINVTNKSNIPSINLSTVSTLNEGDATYFLNKTKKIYGKLINMDKQNGFYVSNDIDHGNSGSPLFNNKNRLVGVVFAKRVLHFQRYGKIDMGGYAIPANELVKFIDKNVDQEEKESINFSKTHS